MTEQKGGSYLFTRDVTSIATFDWAFCLQRFGVPPEVILREARWRVKRGVP